MFVNTKKQEIIDSSISNYIKYYNKTFNRYQKLRLDVFELNINILNEVQQNKISNENKEKLENLEKEAVMIIQNYAMYLDELKKMVKWKKKTSSPYEEEIKKSYEHLEIEKEKVKNQIREITQDQMVFFDNIKKLVDLFQHHLNTNTARVITKAEIDDFEKNGNKKDELDIGLLVLTEQEIDQIVSEVKDMLNNVDTDIEKEVINMYLTRFHTELCQQIQKEVIFEKIDKKQYIYQIYKSHLANLDDQTTLNFYDDSIESMLFQIKELFFKYLLNKKKLTNCVKKISAIKNALNNSDTMS